MPKSVPVRRDRRLALRLDANDSDKFEDRLGGLLNWGLWHDTDRVPRVIIAAAAVGSTLWLIAALYHRQPRRLCSRTRSKSEAHSREREPVQRRVHGTNVILRADNTTRNPTLAMSAASDRKSATSLCDYHRPLWRPHQLTRVKVLRRLALLHGLDQPIKMCVLIAQALPLIL
jgi:hypothetical protein